MTALVIWAGLLLLGALYGAWSGYGGRRFAVVLAACAVLLAGEILLAADGFREPLLRRLGARGAPVAPLVLLGVYFLYALIAIGFDWKGMLLGAAYALFPALLVYSARGRAAGAPGDYLGVLAIWLPVEFRWLYRLWPYPPQLTHTLTILFALNAGLAAFLVLRRLDGIGYKAEWGRGFIFAVGFNFIVFAAIAVPLGEAIGFLTFAPSLTRLRSLPLTALGISFFTAWPEEFLFRGLLQNLFSRTLRSPWAGLIVASVVFGFSHILHNPFPNWRYVILATTAGIFYGRVWMKTGSILPSAVVHALVDISWHVLFR